MFLSPTKDVLEFGFTPGQKVADLGAGTGHYTFALAKILGPASVVVAVDIQKETVSRLKKLAEENGFSNIEAVRGDIDIPYGTHLKTQAFDGVVLSNVLFQIDDKEACIQEAERILSKKGKCVLIEWTGKISQEKMKEMFKQKGLQFERSFNAGDHHTILIFKKQL